MSGDAVERVVRAARAWRRDNPNESFGVPGELGDAVDDLGEPSGRFPKSELSRDVGMGLLFSGLVDQSRSGDIVRFCDEIADYLSRVYAISRRDGDE